MLKSYFKIAWRKLVKNKSQSFFNIAGLAIGLAASMLILLWVQDETGVNSFHRKTNQLYTVYERQFSGKEVTAGYGTPGLLAQEIGKRIPEVQLAANASFHNWHTFKASEKILTQEGGAASKDYFKMFSFPLLEGSPSDALGSPLGIALSKKMAERLFGSAQAAMGKTIRYENRTDLFVTAVFEDVPQSSMYRYDYLLNWQFYLSENAWAKEWGNNGPGTFIQLRADANPEVVRKKIRRFLDNYNKEQSAAFRIELGMQPFEDRYLHSNFKSGEIVGGRIEYVRLFSIVAVFILLIACINFMNLTTARSLKRAREIGVRKVVGALRWNLIGQFLSEAIMLTIIAVVIACVLLLVLLPGFNQVTGQQIGYPFALGSFWLNLLMLTLITGVLSGSYPALFLSSFRPIRVLKGAMKFSTGARVFRKGLVIFQFGLSTLLIIGTIVIGRQVNYVQQANLGYDRQNLVYIPLEGKLIPKYQVFRDAALKLPGVNAMSRTTQAPTRIENGTGGVDWDGKDPGNLPMFTQVAVGYDFTETMKLSMVSGRDFSRAFSTDTAAYIVNETALRKIGYQDPIGKRLTFWDKKGTIVGVVKDFHFNSMHAPINPLIIRLGEDQSWGVAVLRIEAGQMGKSIAALEKLCKSLNPEFPFNYQFSDDEYRNLYKSEEMVGRLTNWFSFLAIFISCLGLLGLAMFTAEQRTREFGIRKVLGASIHSLFSLLSREFIILVTIAFCIAAPVAWWVMHGWLQNFAYHTDIHWWFFAIAALAALSIALLTVSVQAFRAAIANPSRSLRNE
ncbi:MAG: ABC transporter permease [Sphingobacteriaceae bacterium]|nr:MAG: ABC transporter permease [Sphingobacteriaceae bacterium]